MRLDQHGFLRKFKRSLRTHISAAAAADARLRVYVKYHEKVPCVRVHVYSVSLSVRCMFLPILSKRSGRSEAIISLCPRIASHMYFGVLYWL